MKQRIELTAEPREAGKGNSREHRVNHRIPAVIYGAIKPVNVWLDENTVLKYNTRAYENALFNLKSSNKEANGQVALVKSVDIHPLSRRPTHVDLFALDLKKPVRVWVEVRLEGRPVGLAEGGLLNIVARTVEVEVLPTEIPDFFTLDISGLNVGDSVHASDIKITGSIKLLTEEDSTIAGIVTQEDEVVAAPVAVAAAAPAGKAGAKPAPAAAKPAAPGKAAPKPPAAKK
jgi:large subunit ribosomal protein L25